MNQSKTINILHLEDDISDVLLLKITLAREGLQCDIHNVHTAKEYLTSLATKPFDVIISDSGIPGFDGQSALEAAHENFPEIPFIFFSGRHKTPEEIKRLKESGAADCVSKFDIQAIAPTISRVLAEYNIP